jgi:hypothetical protein
MNKKSPKRARGELFEKKQNYRTEIKKIKKRSKKVTN